jgi:ribosomal protein L31E
MQESDFQDRHILLLLHNMQLLTAWMRATRALSINYGIVGT